MITPAHKLVRQGVKATGTAPGRVCDSVFRRQVGFVVDGFYLLVSYPDVEEVETAAANDGDRVFEWVPRV